MKITKVECFPISYPRVRPGAETVGMPSLFVKIHTDEGIVGMGETGHIAEDYIGSTQESNIAIIANLFAPKILLGENPFNIEKIIGRMDVETKNNNQAIDAVDSCLYDIMGKKLGVPVYQLIGGLTNPKIPLGLVISGNNPEELGKRAKDALKAGFTSVKLKVGHMSRTTVEQDLANLRAVRHAIGDEPRLAIDANGGWDYFEALGALKKMEKFDLLMAEQPVPWWDIDGLARLRQKVDIPICADESATEISHLLQIIEKDAADVLFIKLAKVGGILKAQKWTALARAADLPVMCGCMGGSGFEVAHQGHFLAADEWMGRMEQENLGPMLLHNTFNTVTPEITNDLSLNVPRYENGYFYPPDGPGLGVELNEAVLEKIITPGKRPVVVTA
ncbi:mandelate racemase/muconate lactonizing enzyme family protein [Chloroflexota bacterium]